MTHIERGPVRHTRPDYGALKAANSDLLREDVAAGRSIYRGLPEVVTLNHSDICNLRCIMCQRSIAQGTHRLDHQVLDHVVNELFPTARKAVLTTAGGDPLAVDFDFLLERALRFDVRLDVVTNGLLLTAATYARARRALDHLNVSLDSHVPAVYEHIRRGSSFARVWRNLEGLAEARQREPDDVLFSVSAVVMKSNLPHLADFLRAVAPLRPDGVVFQRLQHGEKATPDEEPSGAFTPAEIESHLAAAEQTAREIGLNLFLSEFRRPNVVPAPPRAKVPMTIEGQGVCWFLAQNFNVMYTGEVFPCCIPTDLCLGNVRYQDPVEIWNGEPFRRLREQHLSRTGNLFCSGCLHAPHLPAIAGSVDAERERRAKAFEAESERHRADEERWRQPIYAPAHPAVESCDGGFVDAPGVLSVATTPVGIEVATATRNGIAALREGGLEWRAPDLTLRRRVELGAARAPGTCLHELPDGALLVGFAETGVLSRLDDDRCTPVLELSDPRSFVRNWGATTARDGTVWIGEYGVFPGARCAWLYRSNDGGRSFSSAQRFTAARHVHRVLALSDGAVLVTTGDLGGERRLYRSDSGGAFSCISPAWSGFVAALEHNMVCHFGTELVRQNGLLVYRRGFAAPPEYRAFPAALDLKVRSLVSLDDGTLLALLGMDENLPTTHPEHRPTLLASRDDGRSWIVVHRFADDWSDEPDELVPLGGNRVWAIGGRANHVIEIAARFQTG